jgi:hypothetical protein
MIILREELALGAEFQWQLVRTTMQRQTQPEKQVK